MPSLKITNLRQFEAQLRQGGERLARGTFKALAKDSEKFFKGVARSVESSSEYRELVNNQDLRGKLGLAKSSIKSGRDTGPEDLIKLLSNVRVSRRFVAGKRVLRVGLPSLENLEKKLTHRLTRLKNGKPVGRARRRSWFRWWEFGDRGEITSLTVLRRTISKLAGTQSSKREGSRAKLLKILDSRSRSGHAIQLKHRSPDENSSIRARGIIGRTYGNFQRIFPARMTRTLTKFVRENGGSANAFFTKRG